MTKKTWKIGDSHSSSMLIDWTSNRVFGALSWDENPVHFDDKRMQNTHFKKPIANGIQCISCIGAAIVDMFCSDDTMVIAIEQHNSFIKPVHVGDSITATIEVESIPKEDEYWLQAMVTRGEDGEVAIACRFRVRVLHA